MSYWKALIVERVVGFERLQPALRHREGVVAEFDLVGLLVQLVHREIDDPAEVEARLLDQLQFLAELVALGQRSAAALGLAGDEEHRVAVPEAELSARLLAALGPDIVGDRARRRPRRAKKI